MTAIYATIGFFALLAVVWLGAALWMSYPRSGRR